MDDSTDSRDLDARRTTLRPVNAIFSVRWSTATLDGAHTSTWDCTVTEAHTQAHTDTVTSTLPQFGGNNRCQTHSSH